VGTMECKTLGIMMRCRQHPDTWNYTTGVKPQVVDKDAAYRATRLGLTVKLSRRLKSTAL
jgi:hypothetical protein